jgi:hypothetical protein
MPSSRARTLSAIAFFACWVPAHIAGQFFFAANPKATVENALQTVVTDLKPSLPKKTEDGLMLTAVSNAGTVLTLNYAVPDSAVEAFNSRAYLLPFDMPKLACASEMRAAIKAGATITYVFSNEQGSKELGQAKVSYCL